MNYTEDFYGIRYSAKRGEVLEIRADADVRWLGESNGYYSESVEFAEA